MANNKISITELDFDGIKSSLKAYMQSQTEFSDYNFEGSGLSVLLDILSYNTHYNALYTNLAINEMFLDSASKRDSIISIANNYGYLPRSRRCATAQISMTVPVASSETQQLAIPKYTAFNGTVTGEQYTFYTRDDLIGNKLGSNYIFDKFELYEGTPVTEKFNVVENIEYILENENIDTSTIRIYVQTNITTLSVDAYKYADTIVNLNSDSKVFFVRELEGSRYEIRFGKNNLGYEPPPGAVVTIEYMVTNGTAGNGMKLFTYNGEALPGTPTITLISQAINGAENETNDEIKYNVSRKFRTQNRAVTPEDYIDIISTNYSDIDSISCWSGSEMTPPQYGKAFISIKPKSGPFLIPSEKSFISETILKPRAVIGVLPELIDPIYNILQIDTTVYYNPNETNKTATDLINSARNAIIDYNDLNLKKFEGILRYSRFISDIDNSDTGIKSNITQILIRRQVDVIFNRFARYVVNINNPIYDSGVPEEAVISNGFFLDDPERVYYIDDDGLGKLRLFYYSPDTYQKVFTNTNYGTVNYANGVITVNNVKIEGTVESNLEFIIKPHSNDIVSKQNQIVLIDENYLTVKAVRETSLSTRPFTNSR